MKGPRDLDALFIRRENSLTGGIDEDLRDKTTCHRYRTDTLASSINHSSSNHYHPSRLHIYPIVNAEELLSILCHSRFAPGRRQARLMGVVQRLHSDIARLSPLQPHEPTTFVRKRRTARPRASALGTEGQGPNAESPIEQRTVSNGGRA